MATDAVGEAEFTDFMHARWRTLLRAARALGCTPSEGDDVAQTAMVSCYLKWDKVRSATNRDAYVGRILVNAHRDTFRRRWRREEATADPPDRAVTDQTDHVVTIDALTRALAGLNRGQRQVVALKFFLGLTDPETAEALGIAVGTVKSRVSRALHALAANADLSDFRTQEKP